MFQGQNGCSFSRETGWNLLPIPQNSRTMKVFNKKLRNVVFEESGDTFCLGGQSFLFKQTWRETRFYQAKKYHFLFFSGFLLSITLSFQITKCFLGKPWAPSLPPNAPRPRAFDVARVFDPKALPPEQNFQNPENIAANPDWFVGILRYRYL